MLIMFKLVFFSSFVFVNGQINESNWTLSDLIPKKYNPFSAPLISSKPIFVKVNIAVFNVLALTETDSSFTLDLLFNISWNDNRLNYQIGENDIIMLDSSWKSKLWIPDVYLRNILSINSLNFLQPIQHFELRSNNRVAMVTRLTAKLSCSMYLWFYPQDSQQCFLDIISLTLNSKKLLLQWQSFELDQQISFPKCYVDKHWTTNCSKSNDAFSFSCISAGLKFYRRFSYYFLRYYAPSFLVVIVAFCGFWIPVLGWPARVTVVVTPLLTLVTMGIQINNDINVSYVVAVHIWMMFCHLFIFLCLVEYAMAISFVWFVESNKPKDNNNITTTFGTESLSAFDKVNLILQKIFGPVDWTASPLNRNFVDYISRIVFPAFYSLFILLYIFIFVIPPFAQ